MRRWRIGAILLGLCLVTTNLAAQESIYGIRGLGFPGRAVTARGRALGGGSLALDLGAPANPATVAGFLSITVEAMTASSFRSYTVDTVATGGLNSTRFPLAQLAGPIGRTPLSFALSYAQYAERSYDLEGSDTLMLRGEPVGFTERSASRGGTSDLRAALAVRAGHALWFGVGAHLITGSAKLTLTRTFADSAYRSYSVDREEATRGYGLSAGAVWAPAAAVELGVAVRSDTRARVEVDSVRIADIDLPVSVTAGFQIAPYRSLRWVTSAMWRSWSSANRDVVGRAFDTWEVGSGLEFGGAKGRSRFPLRLGARYATLPFSPTDAQPHELDFALGVGATLAGGRGLIDLTLERAMRRGAGASENAWQLSWTVTVRP